jgi:hypothetical protein
MSRQLRMLNSISQRSSQLALAKKKKKKSHVCVRLKWTLKPLFSVFS